MTDPSQITLSTLAAGLIMVSLWKPLLVIAAFTAWAWVVSTILDKDAARWYFKRQAWNVGHMMAGVVAAAIVLAAPLSFFITFPLMLLVLGGDLGLYVFLRNRDSRVPEKFRWSLDLDKVAEARASKKSRKVTKGITMAFETPTGRLPAPEPETPQYEVRVAAET
ncbi:MAG: hypothetical protein ACNA8P_12555, partial [Phycisphaerales bacterium]